MRNLNTVIDKIVKVAPDLEDHFSSVKSSASYAAPELMYIHWNRAAAILTKHANDHPKAKQIARIFCGEAAWNG